MAPILFVTYLSGIFDTVEKAAPGISGLSFVDDTGWWAKGRNDGEVAEKLSEAAAVAIEWGRSNGAAFDQGKTEAAMFWRKKKSMEVKAKVRVGDNEVPFNKEATRWLGIWLDSQLTLGTHHNTRLRDGMRAMTHLWWLTGQMGLAPANCRKIMVACVQSAPMFGLELWWKGGNIRGTTGWVNELQLLINHQARAMTGCFWTTNLGALSMESGLRPATNQLENRQCHFALRLLSLPQEEMARNIVSTDTTIGKPLSAALKYSWTETERTVLLEEPESFDTKLIQKEREEAKRETKRERPGFVMFTDGSRLKNEAAGYTVAWKTGQTWEGIKTHMGFNQEAFDAECAALACVLEMAARRDLVPDHITIFTDVQVAI